MSGLIGITYDMCWGCGTCKPWRHHLCKTCWELSFGIAPTHSNNWRA